MRTVHVLRLMIFLQVVKHPMLFVGLNNFYYDEVVSPGVATELMNKTIIEELKREKSYFSHTEKDSKDKDKHKDKAKGDFAYDLTTDCYLFEREHHITFSDTTTEQLLKLNLLHGAHVKCVSAAAACPSSDVTHHHLLPYFYSNRGILSLYQNTDTELHKELDDKLADRNKYFPLYEPYDLPVADFKEDHWTRRLVCGIQEHCQKILIGKVFSSTTEGTGNSF